jgi:hypothetical protein
MKIREKMPFLLNEKDRYLQLCNIMNEVDVMEICTLTTKAHHIYSTLFLRQSIKWEVANLSNCTEGFTTLR